jgi:hypothetical protein
VDDAARLVTERYNASSVVKYDIVAGDTMYGWYAFNLTEMLERLSGGFGLGEKVNCTDSADTVDRLVTEPPTMVPSLRTRAKLQLPKTVLVKGKKGAPLVKHLKKVGDGWLKVIIPDGELRRGNTLVYITPQPGKKTVQIFSIRTGTARKDSLGN